MRKRIPGFKGFGAICAVILITLLMVTACGPDTPPPGGEQVVELGILTPATGPVSGSEQISLTSHLDFVNYFNEMTPIPGVTIAARWIDIDAQLSLGISAYRRFVERGVPLLSSNDLELTETLAATGVLEKDTTILITSSTVEPLVYPVKPWIYGCAPTWGEQFAVLADYIMENWKEDRPPRLAFMIPDSGWGWEPEKTGSKYAQSIGMEILPVEVIPWMPLDTTTQLLRLSKAGADFVYIQALQPAGIAILRDADRLGIMDKMQFCGCWASTGAQMIEATGDLSNGYLFPRDMPTPAETEIPGIKMWVDMMMKYHGRVIWDAEYGACKDFSTACEAVRRAIADVGYENLDSIAIKRELDNMKDFHAITGITITYTPEDHRGSNKAGVYTIKDGKIVPASAWRIAPMLTP